MKLYSYLIFTCILNRIIKKNLLFINLDSCLLLKSRSNFLCRNRAEGLSAFAALEFKRNRLFGKFRTKLLCFPENFLLTFFLLCLLDCKILQVLFRCLKSELLGKDEIAGISVVYLYDITLFS